ncbi:unnamed protein product [Paramecium sonneborni]|uniref:Uncharacterized protein n=1 Tax=Paramecium sonneborni TaxID=65129 RepID=A0A8S1QZZ3_9CILI|nr:unnamed protein product [Paramecium sonneborni]
MDYNYHHHNLLNPQQISLHILEGKANQYLIISWLALTLIFLNGSVIILNTSNTIIFRISKTIFTILITLNTSACLIKFKWFTQTHSIIQIKFSVYTLSACFSTRTSRTSRLITIFTTISFSC